MSFRIKIIIFIICLCGSSISGYCQKTLYESENKQIKSQAIGAVNNLKELLQFISDERQSASVETNEAIDYSFKDPTSKIFVNDAFQVFSDVDPNYTEKAKSKLVPVRQYLYDFDLLYKKNNILGNPSVIFNILKTSKLKWDNDSSYYYVSVFFTSKFNNKYTLDTASSYKQTNRVAQIRIKRVNQNENVWTAYIERLAFFEPKDLAETENRNDVVIKKDPVIMKKSNISKPKADTTKRPDSTSISNYLKILIEEQNRIKRKLRDSLITVGDTNKHDGYKFRNNNNFAGAENKFTEARDNYQEAKNNNPDRSNNIAELKLREINKIIDTLKTLIRRKSRDSLVIVGDTNKNGGLELKEAGYKTKDIKKLDEANNKFTTARDYYQKAVNINPDTANHIAESKLKEADKIIEVTNGRINKLIEENSYEHLKNKGDKAKLVGRYDAAKKFYNYAIQENQSDPSGLQKEIGALNTQTGVISTPLTQVKSGEFPDAIGECQKLLKKYKNDSTVFAELHYIEALAYDRYIAYGTRSKEYALDNLNLAIEYSPNYLDAHIARAEFYIKYIEDYKDAVTKAISDCAIIADIDPDDTTSEKPSYIVKKANLEVIVQNYPDAIDDYSKAIKLSPKTDSLYFKKAEFLYITSQFGKAKASLDTAINQKPKYSNAYFLRGLCFFNLNNYTLAGKDFDELKNLGIQKNQIGTRDSLSNVLFQKGEFSFKAKDLAKADSCYRDALKIQNDNYEALSGIAQVHFSNGELCDQSKTDGLQKSINEYRASVDFNRQALKYNPDFYDGHFREGEAHNKLNEYDLAINSFSEAVRCGNDSSQAYIERAHIFHQVKKNYTDAINDYQNAVNLLLKNYKNAKKRNDNASLERTGFSLSQIYMQIGQAHFSINNIDSATRALNTSISFNGNNAEAFYVRGLVYEPQKDYLSNAINDFKTAAKTYPKCKYYYENVKTCLKDRKYYNDAISNIDTVIKLDTLKNEFGDKYYLRGKGHFLNKLYQEAVNDFSIFAIKYEGTKTDNTLKTDGLLKDSLSTLDSSFYYYYGLAELQVDRDTSAIRHFTKALSLVPKNPKVLFVLGCAYAKTGEFDKAIENIQNAFSSGPIKKDDMRYAEDAFLKKLKADDKYGNMYKSLKRDYFNRE